MKILGKLAASLLAALLLVACKGVDNKIEVTVDGPGEVTAEGGFSCTDQCDVLLHLSWLQSQLLVEKSITLTNTPQNGYEFFGWTTQSSALKCSTNDQCKISIHTFCSDFNDLRGFGIFCDNLSPSSKSVTAVFVEKGTTAMSVWDYDDHACLITTSDQIRCWGDSALSNNIPTVINPTELQMKDSLACVLDDSGLQCWGSTFDLGDQPALSDPTAFTVSNRFICAIDQGQVACWGYRREWVQNIPIFNNPTRISSNYRNACVIDDDGLHCWGLDADPVESVPLGEDTIVHLENMDCEITDEVFDCKYH